MSNEQKHTPGPWEWDAGDAGAEFSAPYSTVSVDGGNIIIAEINHYIPEGRANAQLISAAPELLEALEKIVKCERNRAKDLRHRKAWLPLKFSEERIADAEAAIAKAKGETQ